MAIQYDKLFWDDSVTVRFAPPHPRPPAAEFFTFFTENTSSRQIKNRRNFTHCRQIEKSPNRSRTQKNAYLG